MELRRRPRPFIATTDAKLEPVNRRSRVDRELDRRVARLCSAGGAKECILADDHQR
jgi:hypothetical protein